MSEISQAVKKSLEEEGRLPLNDYSSLLGNEDRMAKRRASTFLGIFLLVAFSFALLGIAAYYLFSFEKEKEARQRVEQQLLSVQSENDRIQESLRTLEQEKRVLEKRITESQEQLANLNAKLTEEIKTKTTLQNNNKELQMLVAKTIHDRDALQSTVTTQRDEIAAMQQELEQLRTKKEALESQLASQEASMQETKAAATISEPPGENLEKIIITPLASAEGVASPTAFHPAALVGEVFLVNREYDFVIINLGQKQGVALGDTFAVSHDGALIGKVQAEKIHESMCAAKFLSGFQKEAVMEGDSVTRVN